MSVGEFHEEGQAALLHNRASWEGETTFAADFMTTDAPLTGYATRHDAFVGYGTEQSPDALRRDELGRHDCVMDKGVLALETHVDLAPGETKSVNVIVGVALGRDDITAMRARYFVDGAIDACLPPSWKECAVTRAFRGAITFDQTAGHERVVSVSVDGAPCEGRVLPHSAGARYEVRVEMA